MDRSPQIFNFVPKDIRLTVSIIRYLAILQLIEGMIFWALAIAAFVYHISLFLAHDPSNSVLAALVGLLIISLLSINAVLDGSAKLVMVSGIELDDHRVRLHIFHHGYVDLLRHDLEITQILRQTVRFKITGDRKESSSKTIYLISGVRGLTLLHWLAGLRFRQRKPILILTEDHAGYEGLIRTLRELET